MSNNVLVSVCCSTYNHEKFIAQTLDGFLIQKTNFAVEFLINDDCSQDRTADILKEYENRFPGVFNVKYQAENQFSKGLKPFTHLLFPRVNGKFIALCEGDDYWTDPFKLQKQVDFLTNNEDYSMCFHRSKIVDENNVEYETIMFNHLEEKDFTGEEILRKWSVPTASAMFRTDNRKYITERANKHQYYFGDTPMFLTILEHGKARCLKDFMSVYRVHKGGISKDTSPNKYIRWCNDYITIKSDFGGKYYDVINRNIADIAFGASFSLTKKGYIFYGIKFLVISHFYDRNTSKRFILRIWKYIRKKMNISSKNQSLSK
jgi:glycosyltransferase involved in cell wall biosynthesis